jgi:two-component system, LytTR family, response regulator
MASSSWTSPRWCSSARGEGGVYVVTARGEYYTELTLSVLEDRAPALHRCHKQYLVNLAHLDEIVRQDEGGAVLRTRSRKDVPSSRRLLLRIRETLGIPHRQSKT